MVFSIGKDVGGSFIGPVLAFFVVMGIFLFPCFVHADIFVFVDKNGKKHYSNVPGDPRYRPLNPTSSARRKLPGRFNSYIQKAALLYNLDPLLIKAVMKVESDFDPKAVSGKGAVGLMQLMPETSRDMGVSDPYDPEDNILAGSRYLKKILERFNYDLKLSLAAYNAGPGRVSRVGRIPRIPETIRYVEKVLENYQQYQVAMVGRPSRKYVYE